MDGRSTTALAVVLHQVKESVFGTLSETIGVGSAVENRLLAQERPPWTAPPDFEHTSQSVERKAIRNNQGQVYWSSDSKRLIDPT